MKTELFPISLTDNIFDPTNANDLSYVEIWEKLISTIYINQYNLSLPSKLNWLFLFFIMAPFL